LPSDTLLPDASNLGLLLNHLEHSDQSGLFNSFVRRFLPRFERLSTLTLGGAIQFFLHEEDLRAPVPASRISDGTLRFLAMAALLKQPRPPPLLCLEEPELGLHPDALPIVSDMMVAASQRMQLVVTTHSDVLLSSLQGVEQSILVCDYVGGTQLRRLHAEELTDWLKDYRMGELWRMGHIGGNP